MNAIGAAMMITFAGYGLKGENQEETQESLKLWVSVPEHSYSKDADGTEIADRVLASRFKEMLTTLGVKRLTVLSRTRKGETWTKENADTAELEMRKMLFGSQY